MPHDRRGDHHVDRHVCDFFRFPYHPDLDVFLITWQVGGHNHLKTEAATEADRLFDIDNRWW